MVLRAMLRLMATIPLVTSLFFGAVSGPLSDRLGRRKPLVIASASLVATASLFPFSVAQPWTMLVCALIAATGSGRAGSTPQGHPRTGTASP
ncbi:hypothetical protein C5C13_10875 [Clavibacter michiganensis]|nr:hypothetical protein C5C13_10875 [Clavibacter michiganensis]